MASPKFKNRYRIASARAEWWDYGQDAPYFITCCSEGRQHLFGEIRNGRMELSPAGAVADVLWHQIPFHFPDWELDEFVVMPNHIHGVLIKNSVTGQNSDLDIVETGHHHVVETGHALSLPQRRFQNPGKNTLSTVIGSYKSSVTKNVRRMGIPFGWQSRFHDHIIRGPGEFLRITQYIANNVAKWSKDRFNEND
jgi:REP element-mobilizing transposase RayT